MPTYREEVTEKVAPLVAPIAGANPAGADISYDTDFEAIKGEIDKLSSVDNVEPSWSRIEQLGKMLLTQRGKDLRVASWMTVAKVKEQNWSGFAEALVLCERLSRTFWDSMYPEARRARARLNAIAWMADMVNQHLINRDVSFADGDAIRTCDEVLKDLDQLFAEKFGDAYPGPGQLRSLLRDKVRAIPEPVQQAPAAAPQAPSADQGTAPAPVATVAVAAAPTSAADVETAVAANVESIVQAAAVLRGAEPSRAWAYELQRRAIWIAIQDPPPAEEGQRTYVPPPDEFPQRNLAELRDGSKWFELLNAAEELTSQYIFWLDLHRYVATAMDRIGAQFLAAREAVGREVTHFVSRVPALSGLTFSDGTPFADSATKTWLDEEARKHGGGGGSAASAAASAEDEEIAKRFQEAQKMVHEGKIADGLATALALADRAADARTRFRARLSVGKMALDAPKPELARAMLEHLLGDVEKYGLETWEPGTCATLYSYLLAATREVSRAKGGSPDLVAREQFLFDKLCRLDPAAAIKLST
jgi:type VI secretion system protein VasJ